MVKRNRKRKHKRLPVGWIAAGVCVIGIAALVWVAGIGLRNEQTTTVQSTVAIPNIEEKPIIAPEDGLDLGSGIKLKKLSFACGNFPEDGSDDFLPDMLSATFVNEGEQTLQYAKVGVTVDGKKYSFEFSTLPPGKSVCAFEMNRATTPESADEITAQVEFMSFFPAEPNCMQDQLEITVENGYVSVKNTSSKNLEGEISIFFKNTFGSSYMGGITYRVRIDSLAAGETLSGYSSHAYKDCSEIMFVQFVESNG